MSKLKQSLTHYPSDKLGGAAARCTQSLDPSNTFAILGARGAGKSTLLAALHCDWGDNGSAPNTLAILPPLDCSATLPEIAPGIAILLHLRNYLSDPERVLRLEGLITRDSRTGRGQDLRNDPMCLEDLIGLYTRTQQGYRDLCLDLSTTPKDYSDSLVRAVRERMDLREKLRTWLEVVLKKLQKSAFVVLLDDFDLVPAKEVRRSFQSFFDELHQPRLLFVLTADFHRLQHLSWDAAEEFDDKTGRALLDKLLPPQNRIDSPQWIGQLRREFRAWEESNGRNLSQLLHELIGQPGKQVKQPDNRLALIEALLPTWPRGLENLYRNLAAWVSGAMPKRGHESQAARRRKETQEPQQDPLARLLVLLATCRGEPLLARRLGEVTPEDLVDKFGFPDEDLSAEGWEALVDAARSRGDAEHKWAALPGLQPEIRGVGGNGANSPDPGPQGQRIVSALEGLLEVAETQWGTRDPLRHERLQRLPLRDAAEPDVPLWTELMLDIAFEKIPRNRVVFIDTWRPLRERIADTGFCIDSSHSAWRALLERDGALSHQASLYWLEGIIHEGREQIRIGWRPLLDALRAARDPLSFDLLAQLRIDGRALGGALPERPAADLLPCEIWGSILLIDGLRRCPWSAFSQPLGWNLATYLALAAALVRSAYVYALCESGLWERDDLGDAQRDLLDVIQRQHPQDLLHPEEESVVEKLAHLFREDLTARVERTQDPIATALRYYLESPVYQAVKSLTEQQAQRWDLPMEASAGSQLASSTPADTPAGEDPTTPKPGAGTSVGGPA